MSAEAMRSPEPPVDCQSGFNELERLRGESPKTWDPPDAAWSAEFLGRLAAVLETLEFSAEVTTSLRTAAQPLQDSHALYQAGYQLFGVGLGDMAVAPLARSLALSPGNASTANELALALERAGRLDEAARLFQENPGILEVDELSRALYSHYAAMTGDLDAARRMIPLIDPDGAAEPFLRRAGQRVARAEALGDAIALDGSDLRGWEIVLNGSLLLHTSEFDSARMNGRFGTLWDAPDRFGEILRLLEHLLVRFGRTPTRVVAAADRDSQILGSAISLVMGLEPPADGNGAPEIEALTLVVAYDWANIEDSMRDPYRFERNAVFFAYSLDWAAPFDLAPDVIGLEAQTTIPPWGNRLRVPPGPNGEPGSHVVTEPPDHRTPQQVASALVSRVPTAPNPRDAGQIIELCDILSQHWAPVGFWGDPRSTYYAGGPVRSAEFT